jgi:hypothetical protein
MRSAAFVGVLGVWLATPTLAQALPAPFEDVDQIVCVDQQAAVELLTVYDEDMDLGENLLANLAPQGVCERATFSGKLVADRYEHHTGKQREGHVFEVDVTDGVVLGGRAKAYVLLYVMHDNEARRAISTLTVYQAMALELAVADGGDPL